MITLVLVFGCVWLQKPHAVQLHGVQTNCHMCHMSHVSNQQALPAYLSTSSISSCTNRTRWTRLDPETKGGWTRQRTSSGWSRLVPAGPARARAVRKKPQEATFLPIFDERFFFGGQ